MTQPDEPYVMAHQPPSVRPPFPLFGFLLFTFLIAVGSISSYVVFGQKTLESSAPVTQTAESITSSTPTLAPETVEATIYFDFDRADISRSQTAKLESFRSAIQGKIGTLEITGHSDNIGSATYNRNLSEKRANNVSIWLQQQGIETTENIAIAGLGETQPMTDNTTKENRAQNRRVVLQFTSKRFL